MTTVIVGSTNPVKIEAARRAFTDMFGDEPFEFVGVKAESNVSEQPMSSDETRTGAENRVTHAHTLAPDAAYWIAFEGGVEESVDGLVSVIWVAVMNHAGKKSATRCASFKIPDEIAALIRAGMTLGDADDQVFKRHNSKQQNGAIGLLTHDALTRADVYAQGGILALIPYRNPEFY